MKDPYLIGLMGDAWMADLDAVRSSVLQLHNDAAIVSWLFNAPWAHPLWLWHTYNLLLIHLRMIKELPPPRIYLEGATHEVVLFAVDPAWKLNLQERVRWLHPANFGAQFIEPSDESAAERVKLAVLEVINGELNPDTDAISQWVARFVAIPIFTGWNSK